MLPKSDLDANDVNVMLNEDECQIVVVVLHLKHQVIFPITWIEQFPPITLIEPKFYLLQCTGHPYIYIDSQ